MAGVKSTQTGSHGNFVEPIREHVRPPMVGLSTQSSRLAAKAEPPMDDSCELENLPFLERDILAPEQADPREVSEGFPIDEFE